MSHKQKGLITVSREWKNICANIGKTSSGVKSAGPVKGRYTRKFGNKHLGAALVGLMTNKSIGK